MYVCTSVHELHLQCMIVLLKSVLLRGCTWLLYVCDITAMTVQIIIGCFHLTHSVMSISHFRMSKSRTFSVPMHVYHNMWCIASFPAQVSWGSLDGTCIGDHQLLDLTHAGVNTPPTRVLTPMRRHMRSESGPSSSRELVVSLEKSAPLGPLSPSPSPVHVQNVLPLKRYNCATFSML